MVGVRGPGGEGVKDRGGVVFVMIPWWGFTLFISWSCSKNELNCRGMRYGYDRNDCETVF